MGNPIGGVGPAPTEAAQAQAAIDRGRAIGAKTQRERDYIEAVAVYYRDRGSRAETVRKQEHVAAFEALTRRSARRPQGRQERLLGDRGRGEPARGRRLDAPRPGPERRGLPRAP